MKCWALAFVFAAFNFIPNAVYAQTEPVVTGTTDDEATAGEILVVGNNSSFKLKGNHIKNMVEAFEKDAPEFAPSARLMFQVAPVEGQSLDDISLSLNIDDQFIDISVDQQGVFVLPEILRKSKKVSLIANRAKKAIKIMPLVYTSAITPNERRLGDLRLECRVLWAGFKSTQSVFTQAIFGVAGGCNSSKIGFYFPAPNPLKAILINGKDFATEGVISRSGKSYRPPIYDKTIDNDALLTLTALN